MEKELEIFLITYNREKYLEKTLNSIFDENSPVKNYSVVVLDNNSNDGTNELCKKFIDKHNNFSYVKNNRNIGLSGNICRAFELSSKKYVWILCDNDELDFSAWAEVEKSMKEGKDLILVSQIFKVLKQRNELEEFAYKLAGCMFLPAAIIKTSWISDYIMAYMMAEIPTCFPHMALIYEIVNKKGTISETSKDIVKIKPNDDYNDTHDRIDAGKKHYLFKNGFVEASIPYLNTLKMLDDKNIKQAMVDIAVAEYGFGYINFERLGNLYAEKKITTREVVTVLKELKTKDKISFINRIIKQKLKKMLTIKGAKR